MNRILRLALCCIALATTPARAEEESVPIDNPVATYTRIAGWPEYPDDNGILSVSPDNRASVDTLLVDAADAGAAESFALKLFAKRRLTVQPSSRHQLPDRPIDGHPARVIEHTGRDLDGPQHVVLTLVKLDRPRSFLMIIVQGPQAALKANAAKIDRMLDSIKLLK